MNDRIRKIPAVALIAGALALMPISGSAQNAAKSSDTSSRDRWLHVRVDNPDSKEETVRVNVPLELAEKVLPAIDHDRLHNGKVRIGCMDCDGVDVRTIFEAVRNSKDGEFVTVQSNDADVSVTKKDGQLLVHVHDKNKPKHSQVEVKVPMKVVEALLSGSKDELDIAAGLHALEGQGDVELVSVKDDENTIRVWLDSNNVTD